MAGLRVSSETPRWTWPRILASAVACSVKGLLVAVLLASHAQLGLQVQGGVAQARQDGARLLVGVMGDIHLRMATTARPAPSPTSSNSTHSSGGAHNGVGAGKMYDTDQPLLRSAVQHYAEQQPRPQFLLLIGDNIMHGIAKTLRPGSNATDGAAAVPSAPVHPAAAMSQTTVSLASLATEFSVANALCSRLQSHHVFPVIGNNDLPDDWLLPTSLSANSFWYRALLTAWWRLISGCDHISESVRGQRETVSRTFHQGGFYHVRLNEPAVDILALNTVLWCRKARQRGYSPHARRTAVYQLVWLRQRLRDCHIQGRQAIITGHVAPGMNDYFGEETWHKEYSRVYIDLMTGVYQHTVIGQFFGHFHRDTFRAFTRPPPRTRFRTARRHPPLSVPGSPGRTAMFLTPSLSPIYGNCPTYRVFEIHQTSGAIDYSQYCLQDCLPPLNTSTNYLPSQDRLKGHSTKEHGFVLDYRFSSIYPGCGHLQSAPECLHRLSYALQHQSPRSPLSQNFCSRFYTHKAEAEEICLHPATVLGISCALTSRTQYEYFVCIILRSVTRGIQH